MRPAVYSLVTRRRLLAKLGAQEDLNFLLPNRIPRQLVTRGMGWLSKLEQPWVVRALLALWRTFTDFDLSDALPADYRRVHAIFTRQRRLGARPIDPRAGMVVSPCDANSGACGTLAAGQLLQAKGMPYALGELLLDPPLEAALHGGHYVTLRLTAPMYHRFHAPHDGVLEQVVYHSGDTWKVNPVALKRIEKLFCRNERAVLCTRLTAAGQPLVLVAVAAVMVASIRLHGLDVLFHVRYRGPHRISCAARVRKGEELGRFEQGSTIIVLVPLGLSLLPTLATGQLIRMGQALFQLAASHPAGGEPD